jgi:hypothetical protein
MMTLEFQEPAKPTLAYKMLLILKDFPQIRDSYDLIYEKWNHIYGQTPGRKTIERMARTIQYDLNIYPPSEETKKARRSSQKRIIAEKMSESFFSRVLNFF